MIATAHGTPITAEAAQGRAWGSFFFIGFGSLWLLTGLRNMGRLSLGSEAAVFALGLLALAAATALLRMAGRLPHAAVDPEEEARVKRIFTAVNIIQWVAVATAVIVLILLRIPEYIVPAIGIIVGLHLYPLAGAFRYPMHTVTATVLVLWCAGCIALVSRPGLPGVGAFGTGAILLGSALITLGLACSRARKITPQAALV